MHIVGSINISFVDYRFFRFLFRFFQQKLYELGARKFVVVNSPPIGCVPVARDVLSKRDGCVSLENQMSQMYNRKLKSMLEELTKNLTGSQYVNADSYAIQEDIIQNYIQYGAQLVSLITEDLFSRISL